MQHVAVYVRVSSKTQDAKSQEPDLKRWLAAYAPSEPVEWYRDQFTGTTMDRPAWARLQRAIEQGLVSKIVVWRLDRLGRTAKGLTTLFDDLVQRKLSLVSIKDGVDLSTPAGRMMANVLASVAQYETEVRHERVLAGQEVARANGKRWGGSKPGRRLKVTDEQYEQIKKLHKSGMKKAAIARAVGLSRPTLYRYLEQLEQ